MNDNHNSFVFTLNSNGRSVAKKHSKKQIEQLPECAANIKLLLSSSGIVDPPIIVTL